MRIQRHRDLLDEDDDQGTADELEFLDNLTPRNPQPGIPLLRFPSGTAVDEQEFLTPRIEQDLNTFFCGTERKTLVSSDDAQKVLYSCRSLRVNPCGEPSARDLPTSRSLTNWLLATCGVQHDNQTGLRASGRRMKPIVMPPQSERSQFATPRGIKTDRMDRIPVDDVLSGLGSSRIPRSRAISIRSKARSTRVPVQTLTDHHDDDPSDLYSVLY